jgi:hypothetical protein
MVVRIRLGRGTRLQKKQRKNQHVALALAGLITPVAVMALVLAFWRLAADLKFTGDFPIVQGVFSHWQIWLLTGAALQVSAILLNRYGKPDRHFRETVDTANVVLPTLDSKF